MLHMHNMYSPVLVNLCFCLSLSKAYRKNELTKSPKEAEFQLKMSRSSKGAADRDSSWKGRLNSAYVLQLDSMPLTPPHLLPLTAHKFHGLTTNGYPCHLSHFCLCLTKWRHWHDIAQYKWQKCHLMPITLQRHTTDVTPISTNRSRTTGRCVHWWSDKAEYRLALTWFRLGMIHL